MLSWLVIAFLPRSKYLLISWLQSPSAVILEQKKKKSFEEGNGKPLQYSFLENPMNSMKRQKGEVTHHYSCGEGVKSSLSSTVCRLSSDCGFEVMGGIPGLFCSASTWVERLNS